MNRLIILTLAILAAIPCRAQRLPNIIQIVADDVAYDDIGCFGAMDISTPNIDRLAAEGRRFTSFYAPHSTCTPTRAALMTGCYAPRVGLPNVLFPNSKVGLNAAEITIAELLKGRGYATAAVGNGTSATSAIPSHASRIDLFYGIPYPNDHVPERLDREGTGLSRGFQDAPHSRREGRGAARAACLAS